MENSFGEKIRNARKTKGITQKKLAELVGAKHNSVSDWENNKSKPDIDTVELICGILDLSPVYLMGISNEEGNNQVDKDAIYVESLLSESNDFHDTILAILKTYSQLDEESKNVINEFAKKLKENMKNN